MLMCAGGRGTDFFFATNLILPCSSCGAVPQLPKQSQGCSQHPFLTRLHSSWGEQLKDLDAVSLHSCPVPCPPRPHQEKPVWGAGELSSMPYADFPSNRKPHTLEDARQIHPKFWTDLHIFSTINLKAILELWPKFLHSYTNHPPIRLLISTRIRWQL